MKPTSGEVVPTSAAGNGVESDSCLFAFSSCFKPRLYCFVGPAGSGKSTVCRSLLRSFPNDLALSISTTTRPPRGKEVDGRDYFFVTSDEFQERISQGRFLEWASFNGRLYGTEKDQIGAFIRAGKSVLFDIEVEGVKQIKQAYRDRVVTVFVFPPSRDELASRLRGRGTDNEKEVLDRLAIAEREISVLMSTGFTDYVLITDSKQQALRDAEAIVRASMIRFTNISEDGMRNIFGVR